MEELIKRLVRLENRPNVELPIVTNETPASAAAAGVKGQIAWDSSYIYVCVATDTWKRIGIATW